MLEVSVRVDIVVDWRLEIGEWKGYETTEIDGREVRTGRSDTTSIERCQENNDGVSGGGVNAERDANHVRCSRINKLLKVRTFHFKSPKLGSAYLQHPSQVVQCGVTGIRRCMIACGSGNEAHPWRDDNYFVLGGFEGFCARSI